MNWIDHKIYLEIYPPKEFNFEECLVFLSRSNQEVLFQIKERSVYKLIKVNESLILCKIDCINDCIMIEFPITLPPVQNRQKIAEYIWEWFDLEQDLGEFYQVASQDKVLESLAHKYYGLRIMCIPDLFEALVWAITGQQINLTFAYTLKKRFVEQYGESLTFEGETFWLFPSFKKIASINLDDLRKLQFTTRKAEYIIDIAKAMTNGELTKELLLQKKDDQQIKKSLMMIRGIGAWTADYVMMKCLHCPNSFPVADVGLHNALKNLLDLEKKPTIEEIEEYATGWEGWKAYATFYLWRSLYDKNI
ncbi:DNA-3-methyladenine glycosylase 2 [Lederbergia wuyishanensis]|uniref:DNA-3-methyladenine glycosylase II n=1 Tax=Lederbergia wuyishanensis TaxID=1347903 RepID=A0ABU0D2T6_9BACI|nr:DNA-3-methyladenine glycosylase 2 [Lederbergia wuyishanensis]MCJ8007133.1 DNA glycosylase [Lederbergia wuyishanensis]MDQ0342722.1 DNA-3-methyladenine glycosylase II [Lederbergia wuyishanensis]